jgi:hypothetical protein
LQKQQEVGGGERSASPPATPAPKKVKNKFKPLPDGQSPENPDSSGPSSSGRIEADNVIAKIATLSNTRKGVQEAASVPSTLKERLAASLAVPKGQKTKVKRKIVLDEKKKLKKLKRQVCCQCFLLSRSWPVLACAQARRPEFMLRQ